MNDKLFQEGGDPAQEPVDKNDSNEMNYRNLYVGEDKKYKTEEEALKALHYSQEYIKQLEEENKKAREEISSREALEDLIDQISNRVNNVDESNSGNHSGNEMSERVNANEHNNAMSKDEIAEIVKAALHQEQQKSTFDKNIDTVAKTLEDQWGPGYRALMSNKARELGMSEEALLNLAGTSPNAFLAAVGANTRQQSSNAAPPRSNVNSSFESVKGSGKDWNHYQKMRRENPELYWSKAVQDEIFRGVENGTLQPQ